MDVLNITCDHLHLTSTYVAESSVLLVLATTSLTLHSIFLRVLFNCQGQLPLNTKVLMIHCTLSGGIKSLCLVAKGVFNFALFAYPSGVVIERKLCVGLELPYGISMFALVVSMLLIGMERLWATFKQNNMSQHEIVHWTIIAAQIFIWIAGVGAFMGITMPDQQKMPRAACYCFYSMLSAPSLSVTNRLLFIVSFVIVILINCLVHWKNKSQLFDFTLNTARHSLSRRFIMWSNVKTTRMLLPSSVIHAVSYGSIVLFVQFQKPDFRSGMSMESLTCLVSIQCMLAADSMIHPILCMCCSTEFKAILRKMFPNVASVLRKIKRSDQEETDQKREKNVSHYPNRSKGAKVIVQYRVNPQVHQDLLQQMWNNDAKRVHPLKSAKSQCACY